MPTTGCLFSIFNVMAFNMLSHKDKPNPFVLIRHVYVMEGGVTHLGPPNYEPAWRASEW